MVNKDLLRRTMDAVLAHPELHNQRFWAVKRECGTALCFAGWACLLSGLCVDQHEVDACGETSMTQAGEWIGDAAAGLLGIDEPTSARLFNALNETADLKHYVDVLCAGERIADVESDPWSE